MKTTTMDPRADEVLAALEITYGWDEDGFWCGDPYGGRYTEPPPTPEQVERAALAVYDDDWADIERLFERFHDELAATR